MSDFVHEPVPQVVVVQNPNTGVNEAIEVVNSDFQHVTPDQSTAMAVLKTDQAKERADLLREQFDENNTNEEGELTVSEAYIKARDEGDGIVTIAPPPEKILTRPPTEDELNNRVGYRASTPDSDKAAVEDLVKKGLITEEKRDNWHSEIDKIADETPGEDAASGIAVAYEDSNVSPPPYSMVNGVDITEDDKKVETEDPNSTPGTTPRDTTEGTVTVDPEDTINPVREEIITNKPTEGVNMNEATRKNLEENHPGTFEGTVTGNKFEGSLTKEDATDDHEDRKEAPVLRLGE